MEKLTVLIADDHVEWCDILKSQLEQYSFLELLPSVHDGGEAIRIIEQQKPDILLMDLIMPVYDGLYVITYVREQMTEYNPFIYVLSAIGTEKTNRILRNLDVDYYSIKPINTKAVANNIYRLLISSDRIRYLFPDEQEKGKNRADSHQLFDYPKYHNIELLIEDYLYQLGAPLSLISTKCTRLAIQHCIVTEDETPNVMAIYRKVADIFEPAVSPASIERNIRSTVKKILSQSNETFREHFPNVGYRPNNGEFLFTSAYLIKRQLEHAPDSSTLRSEFRSERQTCSR